MRKIIFICILIIYEISPVFAYIPLSPQCQLNSIGAERMYNAIRNFSEPYTTNNEIANGYNEEYTLNFTEPLFWFDTNTISLISGNISGNVFGNITDFLAINTGNKSSNDSYLQNWEDIAGYNTLGCPTFDLSIYYWSSVNNYVRFTIYTHSYASLPNTTFIATPTPTPTPSPTITPNTTTIPNTTSIPILPTVIVTPKSTAYSNNTAIPLQPSGNTLINITDNLGQTGSNAIRNITTSTNNISGQIDSYNYSTSKSVFSTFIPAIFNMIPAKIWLVIILGWLLETSLILLKR